MSIDKTGWVGLKRFESHRQVGYNLPITKSKLILITVRFSPDGNPDDNDILLLYPDARSIVIIQQGQGSFADEFPGSGRRNFCYSLNLRFTLAQPLYNYSIDQPIEIPLIRLPLVRLRLD